MEELVMDNIEIFITTNGRSTGEYCIQAILAQTIPVTFTVIQNKKWNHALCDMLSRSRSPYFLRVDDDFILHRRALEFIIKSLALYSEKNAAQYGYLLWEVWTGRSISGVKLYDTSIMKSIGGHHFDKYGKVDKKTNQALRKAGHVLLKDRSIIGLHVCGTMKEQQRYERMWQKSSTVDYSKSTNTELKKYCKTHDVKSSVQLDETHLLRVNTYGKARKKTNFYRFVTTGRLKKSLRTNGIKVK